MVQRLKRYFILGAFVGVSMVFTGNEMLNSQDVSPEKVPEHHTKGGFRNTDPGFEDKRFGDVIRFLFGSGRRDRRARSNRRYHFETVANDGSFLRSNTDAFTVTWVGHSTVIVQLDGVNILTDPMWSERCSPVQFAGPKRVVEPGIRFENLPRIDVVLISHNHYDHLDRDTVRRLGNSPRYLVPLGIGSFLERNGIDNFRELDWWETYTWGGIEFVCTPSQHFSGRTPFNRNETLWCSWVMRTENGSCFFGGDSGYFSGFGEIGRRFGPFDLVCLPIGAYLPRWFMGPFHLSPAEALRAYEDLRGRTFVPIHWGVFSLADDPLDMPPVVLREEIQKRGMQGDDIWIMKHGETRVLTPLTSSESPPVRGTFEDSGR